MTHEITARPYSLALRVTAVVVMATALVVMYGWLTQTYILISVLPGLPAMKFNTALCFLQVGAALYLQTVRWDENVLKMLLGVLCLPMFAMAFSSSLQTVFGINTYADDFFITDNYTPTILPNAYPGRMSVLTAFCIMLCSISIMLRPFKFNRGDELLQSMLHVVTVIALLMLGSHALGMQDCYKHSAMWHMTLPTVILFLVMSVGATLLRPHAGITGWLLRGRG